MPAPERIRTGAFSLVEMLAVMGIVLILVMMAIGLTGHAQRVARQARAEADLELIRNALQEHLLKYGSYPDGTNLASSTVTNWLPADFSFSDPWGAAYRYTYRSRDTYGLLSCGPDGQEGNEDDI